MRTRKRTETLIRFNRTTRYLPEDKLLSDVNWKLLLSVSRFDPARGSAFSFISSVALNVLRTAVTNTRKNASRYVELDEAATGKLVETGDAQARDIVDDLTLRIRSRARTTLTDPVELSSQRWYIESFTDDGFEHRRYQCGDACMAVYGLSHSRSRELYDLTMLEVRRVLYDGIKGRQQIPAGRLLGTRYAWMARYRPLLNEAEFTKFVILVRNLSPFVLMLIYPESRSRRQDRNRPINRTNLLWVIDGHPSAKPLFKEGADFTGSPTG